MMRKLLAAIAISGLAAPGFAADVRTPSGADTGGSASGGGFKLPETGKVEGSPDMQTTMAEKRKSQVEAVPKSKVNELRRLAIETFGQASSAEPEEEGSQSEPAGVSASRESYFERMEQRGVNVPGS